jgi:hypothetical protein
MLEIGQSNYGRATGRRGLTMRHWKDKRYCSQFCTAWLKFPFLLAQCVVRAYVEFIVFLTESQSKETEAFEEECLAQVRIRLYDVNVMMNSLKSFLCLSPFLN